MTTKLAVPLRREIEVGGKPYTLTMAAEGFKLVPKGRRIGPALSWSANAGGEAALAAGLNASLSNTGR